MINQNVIAKLDRIGSDPEFIDRLIRLETPEEVREALQSKGVDCTLDEVKALISESVDAVQNGGELSENALEDVAGGFVISSTVAGMAIFLGLTALGVGIGWKAAKGKC